MRASKEKKGGLRRIITIVVFFTVCFGVGYLTGTLLASKDSAAAAENGGLSLPAILFVLAFSIYAHLIIHEAGHLVFGLFTGYRFLSFRIGSLILVKLDGRFQIKTYSLAGTGGQCVMIPPYWKEQGFPYALYNLGGALFNLATGGLSLLIWALIPYHPFWTGALFYFGSIGLLSALFNGIPMHFSMVDNDGSNERLLKKDPQAVYAFYQMLNIHASVASGKRLRDLPEDWFTLPASSERKNPLISTIEVFAICRLMDQHAFDTAFDRISALFGSEAVVAGIHRSMLRCDLAFCAMMRDDFMTAHLELDDSQRKYMRAMRRSPAILRTRFAEALLKDHNPKTAEQIRSKFEQCAKRYPYVSDVESERELMQAATDKYETSLKPNQQA